MSKPGFTLAPATVYPTNAAPSLANAQTRETETGTNIDWLGGKAIALAATATLTANRADATGIDHATAVVVSGLSATAVITLPDAGDVGADGGLLTILRRDASANTLEIACAAGDTINGVAAWTAFHMPTDGDSVTIKSDGGTRWIVVSCEIAPVIEILTAGATRTLYKGTRDVEFEKAGSGGGGGGINGASGSNVNTGAGGGGAGADSRGIIDARTLSSLTVAIGALGAGGVAGTNDGSNGGDVTISFSGGASVITSGGGKGGKGVLATSAGQVTLGGDGGDPGTTGSMALVRGLRQRRGAPGGVGLSMASAGGTATSGPGGSSPLGGGGKPSQSPGAGEAGQGNGAGGAGGRGTTNDNADYAGGNGSVGAVVLKHFILRAA
jgi:hypothetical protein